MGIRIIVADDHKILREGLRVVINREPDMEIIAEASDGQMALDMIDELRPDVVVMDLAMPNMTGIEAIRRISENDYGTKILVLSMHSDKRFVARALKAGAHGYIIKDCASEELVWAIHAVVANQVYLGPAIAGGVVDGYLNNLSASDSGYLSYLTSRECEILQLIAEGKSTRYIAETFKLSTKTVETHRQRIMTKLNISNVVELTKFAIREGLVSIES